MPEPEQPIAERRRAFVAGLLFSLFMTLAFPPVALWGFAFIAITPLVWCAATTQRPLRSALYAGLGSAPFWAFEHRWLIDVTIFGYPVLVAYLSLYPGVFVWIAARLRRAGGVWAKPVIWFVAAALTWSGLETLRGEVLFYGYPWFYVGHPMIDAPLIPMIASAIGVSGLSVLIALIGSVLAASSASLRGAVTSLGTTALIWMLLITLGALQQISSVSGSNALPRPSIVIIQTNVPQNNKIAWSYEQKRADFDRFSEMTRDAVSQSDAGALDLIVWPETMYPGLALDPDAVRGERGAGLAFADGTPTTYFHDAIVELQLEIGIPMLIGAIGVDNLRIGINKTTGGVEIDEDAIYNSVFLIDNGAITAQRYDKMHLTPFGEVMPYISASDWLESKLLALGAPGMSFALEAGADPSPIVVPLKEAPPSDVSDGAPKPESMRVATPICFEASMPGVMRRLVYGNDSVRRADIVIQLSNDGWFGDWRGGRSQQLQLCRWRAIELGVSFARSVNTGLSACIAPNGQVSGAAGARAEDDAIRGWLPITDGSTAYVRYGYLLPWITLAFTALAIVVPMVPRGARRGRSDGGARETANEGSSDAISSADTPSQRPGQPDAAGSS